MDDIGPIPIILGGHPVTALVTIFANGSNPFFSANSELQTSIQTAPSVKGEDVAAVTDPLSLNTGFSLDIDSKDVSLMHPSSSITPSSEVIGQISDLKYPLSLA